MSASHAYLHCHLRRLLSHSQLAHWSARARIEAMSHRTFRLGSVLLSTAMVAALFFSPALHAQRRGRKYKAPPPTSRIQVEVLRENNGKPIPNAAVVFRSTKDGHDEGNLEVKTNEDGVASIDVIPTGSRVQVQIIADGFATFAQEYFVPESDREIHVKMLPPRAQVSAYADNDGKASQRQPGVQEPAYLIKQQAAPAAIPAPAPQPATPK